jgi:Tfp pilus assembly protein PilV
MAWRHCGYTKRNRQQGFSLLEAMISFVNVAFGTLALFHLNAAALDASTDAKSRALALDLAEESIEGFRGLPNAAAYSALADSTAPEIIDHRYATFARSWTVNKLSTAPRYAKLAVTVSWQDSKGAEQSVKLNTNIAEPAPDDRGKWYVSALKDLAQDQASLNVPPTGS